MTLIFAIAIGVLFGAGAFLLLKPDLFRLIAGVVLVANAANLAVMSSGRGRGRAPVDVSGEREISDPLVQAMTITAIVIGFAIAALLLAIVYRVYRSHGTVDLDELSQADRTRERDEAERKELSV